MSEFFTTFKQAEMAADATPALRIRTTDNHGNPMTVAMVRRANSAQLELNSDHKPYVQGQKVQDDYEPQVGEELVWKVDAKDRGPADD